MQIGNSNLCYSRCMQNNSTLSRV
uniref:Uncharacterized protein n=1 Tax=Rhizophora mucronata TaxID=61149 RepID=A0A2P2PRV6_RHIMU